MIQTQTRRCALLAVTVIAVLLCAGALVRAQSRGTEAIPEITFNPRQRTVTKRGTVSLPHGEGDMHNDGADRYMFNYSAGQRLTVNLQSVGGKAIFTIKHADDGSANLPAGVKKWSGELPAPGRYLITVYTREGNDKYALKISLRSSEVKR